MTSPGAAASASLDDPGPDAPILSVIVAAVDAQEAIARCLSALRASTSHLPVELIVVDASTDDTLQRVRTFPGVRIVTAAPGSLVPRLWARGLDASRGPLVAFTIGHGVVSPGWADSLIASMGPDVGGAGGAFMLDADAGAAAAAVFFLRYSAFLAERWRGGPVAGEIAGDNAMYRRAHLMTDARAPIDGFWEVDAHRRLRAQGLTLVAAEGAALTIAGAPPPGRFVRERFQHGRHFGASRATREGRARVIGPAPLVPFVLTSRVARRVWPHAALRGRFIGACPWTLVFATAWAVGEACGALFGASDRSAS